MKDRRGMGTATARTQQLQLFSDHEEELLYRLASRLLEEIILPKLTPLIEAIIKSHPRIEPRWLTREAAAQYNSRTYDAMRNLERQFPKELPIIMIGDRPFFDRLDIDRFYLNRKK